MAQGSFTIGRRAFVAGSAALAAAPAFPAMPGGQRSPRTALFLCDRGCEQRMGLAPPGAEIIAIDGDVTALWRDRIEQLWRTSDVAIAGATRASTLFCLEQLARGAGRRVIQRDAIGPGDRLLWTIAPVAAKGTI